MLLWGQKYYGISWSQHPTSFQCSVSLRKSKLYPTTWVSTMPSWSCVLFTISLISLQLSQVPFSRNHDIQWHDCLKCTHMCIHTHLYLSYKQNLWVERKMICKWYVHITSFLNFRSLISEKAIWSPAHMGTDAFSEFSGLKRLEAESQGRVGDPQMYTDKGGRAPSHRTPSPFAAAPLAAIFFSSYC